MTDSSPRSTAPTTDCAGPPTATRATRLLKIAATTLVAVIVLGQLMHAAYVLSFYGGALLDGEPSRWNQVLSKGYVEGDLMGNLVLGTHLGFMVVAMVGGTLQLLPAVRRRWPGFHRATGRLYLATVSVLALGGLVMIWSPTRDGALSMNLSISINALLILVFGAMALHHARAGHTAVHRRWALRLFLAVSGGWFFRIGLMFWLLVNQGPVGFDPETFRGPTLSILGFVQFLLPLAVLEVYLRVQGRPAPGPRLAMAAGLGLLVLVTATGIFGAVMGMWLPHM